MAVLGVHHSDSFMCGITVYVWGVVFLPGQIEIVFPFPFGY